MSSHTIIQLTSPEDERDKTLNILSAGLLLCYILLLIPVIYNCYNYVYLQKRYKAFLCLSFYVLANAVIILRICLYVIVLKNVYDDGVDKYFGYVYSNVLSTYFKIALGYAQLASMLELTIRLSSSAKIALVELEDVNDREGEKVVAYEVRNDKTSEQIKINYLYGGLFAIDLSMLSVATWECIDFKKSLKIAHQHGFDDDRTQNLENDLALFGWISGGYFGILSIILIVTYYVLNKALNKMKAGKKTSKMRAEMKSMFLVFIITYIVRTIYQILQGNLYDLSSSFIGYCVGMTLPVLFDYSSIGAVLYLHFREMKLKKK